MAAAADNLPAIGKRAPAPSTGAQDRIVIKGSDTMLLLVERRAQKFMRLHPGIPVYVEGGGTRVGIKALFELDLRKRAAPAPGGWTFPAAAATLAFSP